MHIPKHYNPRVVESKWYDYWLKHDFFHSEPDEREPYTIVIPPPNVTGVLHMGHILNNTLQDILIRRARMQEKNACWVPGTDHASIATEAKVVAKLKSEGIDKHNLTREEFLKHCWEWTEKHGGIILEQLKKLGCSCDWKRTKFTMDSDLSESVIDVFIDLYKKGYIYRSQRMVNWDTKALTAISDEEVIYKEVQSNLYYIRYKIENTEDEWLTIATTRPETILADTAVAVNPIDKRYINFIGKTALVPLINRPVPIIADSYVDPDFGTGVLKITPAHDANDYVIGLRHNLPIIDILNDDGTLNEKAQLYIGEERLIVREKIVTDLKEKGYLVKIEDYISNIGFSERTDEPIEPKISLQWFLKMKDLSKPALENVMNDNIKFYPAKFKNTYKYWMENIKDWCISRQLWWGHQIPVYYIKNSADNFVVAKTIEEALQLAKEKTGDENLTINDLKQDEDVLDTWFSSWLWPISVFDNVVKPQNKTLKYYYPTDVLVTAPEIMFFWVARMIIAGYEYMKDKPFKNVYFTGIVRDKQRRKMSKSLGNSPEPLELIEKYGADSVRMGMMLCSPAGNDLLYDEALIEQGRNFCNKIWNAFRLINGWTTDENLEQPSVNKIAIDWFFAKLNSEIATINDHFSKYRLSDALMTIYKLIWDEFCSYYLEIIKPAYQKPIDAKTYASTIDFFETLLKILHPFMPFITEEIWHLLKEREEKECIIIASWPGMSSKFPLQDRASSELQIVEQFEEVKEVINNIRNFRKEKNIPYSQRLNLFFKPISITRKEYIHAQEFDNYIYAFLKYNEIIKKFCNIEGIKYAGEKIPNAFTFIVGTNEFFIPYNENIDINEEKQRLNRELEYTKGFLEAVMKKLDNAEFIRKAPQEVIEREMKKKKDAEEKIKILEEQLKMYNK